MNMQEKKEEQNNRKADKNNEQMVTVSPSPSITTLNVNGLDSPIKEY